MSANRYSALNRRTAGTSSLFESYPGNASSRPSSSASHTRPNGYGNYNSSSPRPPSPYNNINAGTPTGPGGVSAYPYGANGSSPHLNPNTINPSSSPYGYGGGATSPNINNDSSYSTKDKPPKHFTTAVLDSLESQNETTQTSLLSSKVAQLKLLTVAIGDEIRDSSSLAAQINDQFEGAGTRLKGTMKRMMRMADSTGIGWRVWLLFFVVVWALFAYVWLF